MQYWLLRYVSACGTSFDLIRKKVKIQGKGFHDEDRPPCPKATTVTCTGRRRTCVPLVQRIILVTIMSILLDFTANIILLVSLRTYVCLQTWYVPQPTYVASSSLHAWNNRDPNPRTHVRQARYIAPGPSTGLK